MLTIFMTYSRTLFFKNYLIRVDAGERRRSFLTCHRISPRSYPRRSARFAMTTRGLKSLAVDWRFPASGCTARSSSGTNRAFGHWSAVYLKGQELTVSLSLRYRAWS
jgi:hypothetical protein